MKIFFADTRLKKQYERHPIEIKSWIDKAVEKLEANVLCGVRLQRKLIPDVYIKKYRIINL